MDSIEKELINSGQLSEHQVSEIREMFMIVDADKSGQVSYDEIAKIMSKLSKSNMIVLLHYCSPPCLSKHKLVRTRLLKSSKKSIITEMVS